MKRLAFTLTELLIALVIIGVIAAITIPSVLNNSNKMEFKSSLKKSISSINRAIALHYSLTSLSAQDYTSADELVSEVFMKRMNVINEMSEFTSSDCEGISFAVQDGMIYCVANYYSDNADGINTVCNMQNTVPCIQNDGPNLWIDVNGLKKPNTITTSSKNPKDIYQAQIYSMRVVPYGVPTQEVMYEKQISNYGVNNDDNTEDNPSIEPDDNDNADDDNIENNDNPDNPEIEDFPQAPPEDMDEEARNFWDMLMGLLKNLGEAFLNTAKELWNNFINNRK